MFSADIMRCEAGRIDDREIIIGAMWQSLC